MDKFSPEIRKALSEQGYCDYEIGIVELIRPLRVERPIFDRENAKSIDCIDLRTLQENQIVYVRARHPSAAYLMRVDEVEDERRLRMWLDSPYRGSFWCFESALEGFPTSFLSHFDKDRNYQPLTLRVNCDTSFPYFSFSEGRLILYPDNLDWGDTVQEIKIGSQKQSILILAQNCQKV